MPTASIAKDVTLSLGLLSTKVSVYTARDPQDQTGTVNCCVAGHEPVPVTRPLTCTICGLLPHPGGLVKAILVNEVPVLISAEDLRDLKADELNFKGLISLAHFPADQVSTRTIQGEKFYFLTPKSNDDNYQTLAALIDSEPEKAFLVRYAPRTRASLFVARVIEGVILLEERVIDTALRKLPEVPTEVDGRKLEAARAMLPMFETEFDASSWESEYDNRLAAIRESSGNYIDITLASEDEMAARIAEAIAAGNDRREAMMG